MEKIKVDKKLLDVVAEYEVVVVGGGTAGAVAAISSAREGLDTLLVEQYGALGGSQTLGLVTPMMHNHIDGNPSSSSINKEINDRMIKMGYGVEDKAGNKGWFDPQMLKIVLEDMVIDAGCDILYHTVLIDVIKEENRIKALVVHNKDGSIAIKTKRIIDCTGDADVCYLAGLEQESGNKDGYNQSVSLRFQMTNIEMDSFGNYLKSLGQKELLNYPFLHTASVKGGGWPLDKIFEKNYKEGFLTKEDLKYFQVFSVPGKPKDLAFNCPELGNGKNVLSGKFISKKQIEGKRAILRLVNFLKRSIPGFKKAYISDIAVMVGIRESRRIRAEYQLNKEDVLRFRKFSGGIARSNYPLDVHGGYGEELKYEEEGVMKKYYEIPYKSLVPLGIDNVIVAGRSIGADFIAQSTLRIQPTCRAMGEAAGIASKISLDKNIPYREVDGRVIRRIMVKRGAELGG